MGASSREPHPGQQALFELPVPAVVGSPLDRPPRPRARYIHTHTPEELAAFERSRAIASRIRPDFLNPGERLCPGGCLKIIRGEARHCCKRSSKATALGGRVVIIENDST